MSAAPFLVAKPAPKAGAGILVGRLDAENLLPADLGSALLWIVDAEGAARHRKRLPASVVILDVLPDAPERLETGIDDFLARTPRHLPSLHVTSDLPAAHAAGYAAALAAVSACLEASHRARVTRQQDAFAWQSHLLQNASGYARHRLPSAWENALAGLPAIVCGAGPSLDATLGALASAAPRAVVFAADSSLRALAAVGVPADFAVSIDAAKSPQKCLPEHGAPTRIVLSALSPPEWTDAAPDDHCYFLSGTQLTLDWWHTLGLERTSISARENCGATALELARFLGCAPIYLCGLDLALGEGAAAQRHHGAVDASIYESSGFAAAQMFPRVPGNFADTVPTHVIGDWRALDRRLATWPGGLVRVVTDRGARLSNTQVLRPAEFVLAATGESKADRLAALPGPQPPAAAITGPIAVKLHAFGVRLIDWAPQLHRVWRTGGVEGLVNHLRSLFADPENGYILGAYALKLMPHLLPPLEEDSADWTAIIAELEALGRDAVTAASALGLPADGPRPKLASGAGDHRVYR